MTERMRTCRDCQTVVPAGARKRPSCGESREDIKREMRLSNAWGMASGIPVVAFFVGVSQGWWHDTTVRMPFGRVDMSETGYRGSFSVDAFLSSPIGWALLGSFIGIGWISLSHYFAAERKKGR